MIRELVVAAVAAGAAIGTAPAAGANPQHYPGDVPGMVEGVSLDEACDNWERYTFGHGPSGEALACHFIPNQYPDPLRAGPVDHGFWMISYPLYGVQDIGAPCPNPQSAAQSPDGLPLLCVGAQGWQPGIYVGGAGPYAPPGIVPYPLEHPQPYYPPFGS
jgi:hypothetical protein